MVLKFLFGKSSLKKNFIQEANRRSQLKGTIGSFGRWCKSKRLDSNGRVTMKCIKQGLRSNDVAIRRRANFARNIKGYVGATHTRRKTRFGKKSGGQRKKYTLKGGRKSPGVSATLFPVGTVKTGLDGNNWVIVKTVKGVKRWKLKSRNGFGLKTLVRVNRKREFEKDKRRITKLIAKEIEIAEKIIEKYPANTSLLKRTIKLFNNTKQRFVQSLTYDNMYSFLKSTVSVVELLTRLLVALTSLSSGYTGLMGQSRLFANILGPLDSLLDKYRPPENRTGPENRYHFYNHKRSNERNGPDYEPVPQVPRGYNLNVNFPRM